MDPESESENCFRIFSKFQPFSAILAKISEFLGHFKNGALNFQRPPSSNFWMLNPNLKIVSGCFQNFIHFHLFLSKMAECLGYFEK